MNENNGQEEGSFVVIGGKSVLKAYDDDETYYERTVFALWVCVLSFLWLIGVILFLSCYYLSKEEADHDDDDNPFDDEESNHHNPIALERTNDNSDNFNETKLLTMEKLRTRLRAKIQRYGQEMQLLSSQTNILVTKGAAITTNINDGISSSRFNNESHTDEGAEEQDSCDMQAPDNYNGNNWNDFIGSTHIGHKKDSENDNANQWCITQQVIQRPTITQGDNINDSNKTLDSNQLNESVNDEEVNGILLDETHESGDDSSCASRQIVIVRDIVTENSCAICMERYNEKDTIVCSGNPDCPHVYHRDCLVNYLVVLYHDSSHNRHHPRNKDQSPCPTCRRDFLVPHDGNENEKDEKPTVSTTPRSTAETMENQQHQEIHNV